MGVVIKLIGTLGIIGGILFLISAGSIIGGVTNSSPYANVLVFLFGFGIIVPSIFIFGFGEIIELLRDCRNEIRAVKAYMIPSPCMPPTPISVEKPKSEEVVYVDVSKRFREFKRFLKTGEHRKEGENEEKL